MKTLIINGSPRRNGNTSALLSELKNQLHGEVTEISAYYNNIKACIDCRQCWTKKGCVIEDDMSNMYIDDFDAVVIASPLYMSNLTGPLIGLASRFQAYYAAKRFLHDPMIIKRKLGVLIIVGGGDGGPDQAITMAKWMFKKMNADINDNNIILSLYTDEILAKDDIHSFNKIKDIANRINQENI